MSRTTNEPCETRWLMSRTCRGDIPSIVSRIRLRLDRNQSAATGDDPTTVGEPAHVDVLLNEEAPL